MQDISPSAETAKCHEDKNLPRPQTMVSAALLSRDLGASGVIPG